MKTRILSGLVGVAIVAAAMILPPLFLCVAAGALAAIAVWEAAHETGINRHAGQLTVSMFLAAVSPFLPSLYAWQPSLLMALALVYLIAMGIMQVISHEKQTIEATGYTVLMTLLIAVIFACIARLRIAESTLLQPVVDLQHGRYLLLCSLFIPWMADIGAYFVGVFCGKHKLCPTISPKKTVEGLVGGLILSPLVIVGTLFAYTQIAGVALQPYAYWLLAGLSLIGSVLSVFGDLFASVIKRQHGIKDFGTIMPGHGGVMDRFDSFIFALPVICLVLNTFPLFA